MRAITYVHPGEHLSCYGCHESKWEMVPSLTYTPKALTKKPSKILEEFPGHHTNPQKGGIPHNYHLLAKPALKKLGYDADNYNSLCRAAFYFNAGFNGGIRYSVQGGSRTVPGYYGARYSQIGKKLLSGDRAKITDEEYRRIVMWLDGQSYELGSCTKPDAQRAGQVVWPRTDVDPSNPLGVEDDGHPVEPVDVINDLKEKGHIDGPVTRDLILNPILVQHFGTSVVISNPNRENLTLKICNSRGQVLRMLYMNRAQNKIRTKVTDLPTGLYFITLTTDTRNISKSMPVM